MNLKYLQYANIIMNNVLYFLITTIYIYIIFLLNNKFLQILD